MMEAKIVKYPVLSGRVDKILAKEFAIFKTKLSFLTDTMISATKTPGNSKRLMFVPRDKKHEDFYFDKDNNFLSG